MIEYGHDYSLRGKCKEMSDAACSEDPSLRLVRGYYHCPVWEKQPHWWCVRPDGTIHDPTAAQFPSLGTGVYEEFDGNCECDECGKIIKEKDCIFGSSYVFCSDRCYAKFVGVDFND